MMISFLSECTSHDQIHTAPHHGLCNFACFVSITYCTAMILYFVRYYNIVYSYILYMNMRWIECGLPT